MLSALMRRPLLLTGFMATGKSTIGRRLAEITGRSFVDLDTRIESSAGQTVAELFRNHGEAHFRALERQAIDALLREGDNGIVALGGGALLARDLRLRVLDHAVLVSLQASPSEIARRAGGNSTRPLLAGPDPIARAEELLELRGPAYAEAHARVATENRSADDIAREILEIWQSDPLAVAAGEASYSVEIGRGLIDTRLARIVGKPSRPLLVSDRTVFGLYGARVMERLAALSPHVVKLEPGEEHKHIGSIEPIWREALQAGADRKSLFIGLGGGVVTDMTGFAAATYMRGVAWIGLPSTLLAMVDASVGGKTGVDLASAKNAVGAFHQPRHVLCDVDLLATETPRAYRSALAEVIKTALIGDPELLDFLEHNAAPFDQRDPDVLTEIVRRSIRVKARIVSQDQHERGLRAVLNLGHTVGHALESVSGFSRLTHGEAVSLGLVAALRIGQQLGLTPNDLAQRTQALLEQYGLPADLAGEPLEAASELLGHDKKRGGSNVRFVVARAAGQVETVPLALTELQTLTRALA